MGGVLKEMHQGGDRSGPGLPSVLTCQKPGSRRLDSWRDWFEVVVGLGNREEELGPSPARAGVVCGIALVASGAVGFASFGCAVT